MGVFLRPKARRSPIVWLLEGPCHFAGRPPRVPCYELSTLKDHVERLLGDPGSSEAADLVRRAAREKGELRAYAEAFWARADGLRRQGQADEAVESLLEVALIYEEELDDFEWAARAYQQILDLRRDHRRSLFALGRILHDLARWEELVALYRSRLNQTKDDGEATTLHIYISELLSERLDAQEAAFEELLAAARLTPRNIRIISRLEKLGERIGRTDQVAVVIGDLILHQEDPRVRAALSLRLAELHLGPLNDPKRALAYLRAALADDGGNPEVLSEVEDVFRERARFDELAAILEDSVRDRRTGPHRVRLECELSRIYELELGDGVRAMAALNRALECTPEDRDLLDAVMRLGLKTQSLSEVAKTYERVSTQTENPLLKTYLRLKLGHLYEHELGRRDLAMQTYAAILEDEPGHRDARRRLLRLCRLAGDPPESPGDLVPEPDGEPIGVGRAFEILERMVAHGAEEVGDEHEAFEVLLGLCTQRPTLKRLEAAAHLGQLVGEPSVLEAVDDLAKSALREPDRQALDRFIKNIGRTGG